MSETMEVDDDFATKSSGFMSWLQSSGAVVNEKIELADLRKQRAGRGVVTKEDIEVEEVLFRIPRAILLNTSNSDLSSQHPDLLQSLEGDLWLELNLTMLYENGKSDSMWRPYLDVLPREGEFDTLMYWDESELKELEASAVVNKIGKESADKMFKEKIWSIVASQKSLFGYQNDVQEHEVLSAAHRMGSLIMAYAFDIESDRTREIDEEGYVSEEEDEDMPKAMVPLADMLNADADRNNARLFYEPDALVMKALKPITKGEEVFNDYGPLPQSDLLRRYGYVSGEYRKYDVVEISTELIMDVAKSKDGLNMSDADFEAKAAHLAEVEDLLEDGYDICRACPEDASDPLSVFPPALKAYITILALDLAQLPKPSKLEKLVASNDFPIQWYTFLRHILEARLAQYSTPVEEDKQHLEVYKQRLQGGMWLTNQQEMRRRVMAMSVRIAEKEILTEAISLVRGLEKGKQDVNGVGNDSPRKRKASSKPASGASTPKRNRR